MSTAAMSTSRLTWEGFLALPEDPAYRHAELIDGEVVVNPPTRLHQRVVGRLWSAVDAWARQASGRGEVTMDPPVQINEQRGYLPDVAWFPESRCAGPEETAGFAGPPALVIEVLSPSTRTLDALRKRSDYARVGADEFWLIDPEEPAAQVYRRPAEAPVGSEFVLVEEVEGDGKLTTPLLEGFGVMLSELIRR